MTPFAPNAAHDAPIGVFDSGIGGLSILRALRRELPHEHFVYWADSGHAPYGERDDAFVQQRTRHVTAQLRRQHSIKALVIACNTATAVAGHTVREENPDLPIIGVEPALKPAVAQSRTGRIGVMATRSTLGSAKFHALLTSLQGSAAQFVLQACDGLAKAIEQQEPLRVQQLCKRYTTALGPLGATPGQIDTLVLGCTHYVFAQEILRQQVGPAVRILDTCEPVARQTHRLLDTTGALAPPDAAAAGSVHLLTTGDLTLLQSAAARWLDLPTAHCITVDRS